MLLSLFHGWTQAQEKKSVAIQYIDKPLIIDGLLDDSCYSKLAPAKYFVQLQPYNGRPSYQPTEVWLFYDQTSLYVGAMLYDNAPDNIFNYISERNDLGMSDYFGVYLDPYNTGITAFGFFVTPAGVQTDLKAIKGKGDNESESWNAVWQSKTSLNEKGWVVEMSIPYAALRFPGNGNGTWGLNMLSVLIIPLPTKQC